MHKVYKRRVWKGRVISNQNRVLTRVTHSAKHADALKNMWKGTRTLEHVVESIARDASHTLHMWKCDINLKQFSLHPRIWDTSLKSL